MLKCKKLDVNIDKNVNTMMKSMWSSKTKIMIINTHELVLVYSYSAGFIIIHVKNGNSNML